MEFSSCEIPAFCVIGKEGLADGTQNIAQLLWQEANTHFAEVEPLALRDESGIPVGFWGAMTDCSRNFLPWEENLTRGLYLAGVQTDEAAQPPAGWVKWKLPAFRCVYAKVEGDYGETLRAGLKTLEKSGWTLAGAVQEYNCPQENGQLYLLFPVERL